MVAVVKSFGAGTGFDETTTQGGAYFDTSIQHLRLATGHGATTLLDYDASGAVAFAPTNAHGLIVPLTGILALTDRALSHNLAVVGGTTAYGGFGEQVANVGGLAITGLTADPLDTTVAGLTLTGVRSNASPAVPLVLNAAIRDDHALTAIAPALPLLSVQNNGTTVLAVAGNGALTLAVPLSSTQGGTGSSTPPGDGQILVAQSGAYTPKTLVAGANITLTGDATHLTISATGGGGGGIQLAGDLGGTLALPTVSATHLAAPLPLAQGGTGANSAPSARTALSAAASGANGDITSLSALSTPLSVVQGGTGANTLSGVRTAIGAAASGANSDITALTGLSTPLAIAQGGTNAADAATARANLGIPAFPLAVAQGGTGATTLGGLRAAIGAAASGANSDITSLSGLTALSVATGTVVTDTPALALSQTWNAGGTTFELITAAVTSTAAASGSTLINLQVGGASRFKVDAQGNGTLAGTLGIGTATLTPVTGGLSTPPLFIASGSRTNGQLLALDSILGASGDLVVADLRATLEPAVGFDSYLLRIGGQYATTSGAIHNSYGIAIGAFGISGGSTFATSYGLYVTASTFAATNYAAAFAGNVLTTGATTLTGGLAVRGLATSPAVNYVLTATDTQGTVNWLPVPPPTNGFVPDTAGYHMPGGIIGIGVNSAADAALLVGGTVTLANSTTTTDSVGVRIQSPTFTNATAAVLTSLYGLHIPALSLGGATGITVTTAYGIYAAAPTAGSANWAGYFAGPLAVTGTLTLGTAPTTVSDATGKLLTSALTGTLAAAQFPALAGDVTTSAGSLTSALTATTNGTLATLSALTSISSGTLQLPAVVGIGTAATGANLRIAGSGTTLTPLLVNAVTGQSADLAQFQVNGGTLTNINAYGNLGLGSGNTYKRVRLIVLGNLDGVAEASSTVSMDVAAAHITNPGSGSYGLYVGEAVSVASGTTSTYTAGTFAAASKSGAGTYATSIGLNVIASSFATANYAAIFQGGNVGIGTVAPAYGLDLNGTLHATGAVIFDNSQQVTGNIGQGGAASGNIQIYQSGTFAGGNATLYGFYQGQTFKPNGAAGYAVFSQIGGTVDTSITGGAMTAAYGMLINGVARTGANTIPTAYGLFVNQPTAGTTNVSAYITGSTTITGTLSKPSGTFIIDHPHDPTNYDLAHGFVEAPRYDLLYRGAQHRVQLKKGRATVNIDVASNMSLGTFAALTREEEAEVFLQPATFARCIASPVKGGVFTITCEDTTSTQSVSWFVVAERQDAFVRSHLDPNTDHEGRFIPERLKADPDTPGTLQNDRRGHYRTPQAWGKENHFCLPPAPLPVA